MTACLVSDCNPLSGRIPVASLPSRLAFRSYRLREEARMAGAEKPIDLRSDTVTRPSAGMRRAMAEAPVGDDQYGEDPSVNRLQERIAELLGKEAALFVPSGTMSNQIALKLLTRPGDEVLLAENAHMIWNEAGAGAANSGVQFTAVGRGGLFTAAEFRAALKPPGHIV